jgi:hypothetical protein
MRFSRRSESLSYSCAVRCVGQTAGVPGFSVFGSTVKQGLAGVASVRLPEHDGDQG